MSLNKYIKKSFDAKVKENMVAWRSEPATIRVEHPTRIDRARALGYKAKQGYFVVRQRVKRGGHRRPHYRGGKKPTNTTSRLVLDVSYRRIAEVRAAREYVNAEVLNSYYLAKDGKYYWFEIIMVDKAHPAVLADERISWIAAPANRGRAFRGLTSAGRKGRGLRTKGKGTEKARPSLGANKNRL